MNSNCYKYKENFFKVYANMKSAFLDELPKDWNNLGEEDIIRMYILEYSLRKYFNIICMDKYIPEFNEFDSEI